MGPYFWTAAPTFLPRIAPERERVLHALGAAHHQEGPVGIVAQPGGDELGADRQRLGAAAADAGHGQRRHVVWKPAAPAHPLRRVDRVAVAVLGHAHHHVADQVDRSTRLLASVALMARPPSWVVEKRENSPGSRLLIEDVGARQPAPAVEDDDGVLSHDPAPSLVQEGRRHARPVLDEVPHADVHVDGPLAAAEARAPRCPAPRPAAAAALRGAPRPGWRRWRASGGRGRARGSLVGTAMRRRVDRRQLHLARPGAWRTSALAAATGSSAGSPVAQPQAQASAAPMVRPVRSRSAARSRPISRGSRCVPP